MPAPTDSLRHQDRAVRAWKLRHIEGRPYEDIASELGVHLDTARRLVKEGSKYFVDESERAGAKERLLSELAGLRQIAYGYLQGEYWVAQFGKVAKDEHGNRIRDIGPNLAAMDRIMRIGKAEREILGTDAPSKRAVEVITHDAVTAEIQRLEREIAAAEATPYPSPRTGEPAP